MTYDIIFTIVGLLGIGITMVGFPGIYVLVVALIIAGIQDGFTTIPLYVVVIFSIISILASVTDQIIYALGAKKFGASMKSLFAGMLFGLIGTFMFGPVGLIVGLVLGTIVVEYYRNPDIKDALKKGGVAVVSYFVGYAVNILLVISMYIWFLFILW